MEESASQLSNECGLGYWIKDKEGNIKPMRGKYQIKKIEEEEMEMKERKEKRWQRCSWVGTGMGR